MGDDIGGVKKMGAGNRHSVAQVLLASTLMMLVATSHCTMSTTTSTSGGNSTTASSAWCEGHIVDGQCIRIAQAYGGGEHLDLDVMDRMLVEYDDSGETSSRRVLDGISLDISQVVRNRGPFCYDKGQRYTCQNTNPNAHGGCQNIHNRDCQM